MTTGTPDRASAAEAMPISAMAAVELPTPPAPPPPSFRDKLRQRLQPFLAHGVLFFAGLSGGLAVATASTVAVHYFIGGSSTQLAAARLVLPPRPLEPLDVEIQKAKAELDAAIAKHGS
jgi:hypothetical protein